MRILTVRQPWAWAIIHGGKDVENRVRNIAEDYRGPVAIHAAKEWDDAVTWNASWETVLAAMKADGAEPFDAPWQRERGVIIGVVDLVAVHGVDGVGCMAAIPDCSPWAEKTPGVQHLRLANPRALAEPIPYRGALGLRHLDDDTRERILAQVERPSCPECRAGSTATAPVGRSTSPTRWSPATANTGDNS